MFMDAFSAGPSYVSPGDHKLYTSLPNKEYSKMIVMMEVLTQKLLRGVTLLLWIGGPILDI